MTAPIGDEQNHSPGMIMKSHSIEPIVFDDLVFENEDFIIRKKCFWPGCSVWRDAESGLLKVLLPGSQAFNTKGSSSTFARPDGARATKLDFSYIDDFHEGLALVALPGKGYGFVDAEMNFVVQPQYALANKFHNGFAVVTRWDEAKQKYRRLFVDHRGEEHCFVRPSSDTQPEYEDVRDHSEGMFRVSDMDMGGFWGFFSLAYHSDHSNEAGFWGYADSAGRETVSPRYIFAYDFKDGRALVCTGKWTKDEKWNNEYNNGRYWSEEQLWGMIDKTGEEVIPCIFDEIKPFWETDFDHHNTRYFQAHFGGWKNGAWGIIDASGKWVVEPAFQDFGYEISKEGCFVFCAESRWSGPDEPLQGIYSIPKQRVLFDPKFVGVDFRDDGTFKVERFSEELGRNIEQIIDASGMTLWPSSYSSLYERKNHFEVSIETSDGNWLMGAVDKQGNEIVPCKYNIAWDGLLLDCNRIIFKKDEKCGLVTFDDEIIIEPIYVALRNLDGGLIFEAKQGGSSNLIDEGLVGLLAKNGEVVLPIQHKRISFHKDLIISQDDNGSTLFSYVRK